MMSTDTAKAYCLSTFYFLLLFDHLAAGCFPCLHAAKHSTSILVTGFIEQKRRTGACMFSRSGTVGDDAFGARKSLEIPRFEFAEVDIQRALDMRNAVGFGSAHVDDQS